MKTKVKDLKPGQRISLKDEKQVTPGYFTWSDPLVIEQVWESELYKNGQPYIFIKAGDKTELLHSEALVDHYGVIKLC